MNDLIADQIEWLLSNNGNTGRLGRQLITLSGFLTDGTLPAPIAQQIQTLSRLVVLQDMYESLLRSLDQQTRYGIKLIAGNTGDSSNDPNSLLSQIDAARRDIANCETVNYGELISWIVHRAREMKILGQRTGRR